MQTDEACPRCRRPLGAGPDRGCARCGRPPFPDALLDDARARVAEFAARHAGEPWLRSASLLGYSLRSRQRGFLEDLRQPFTRAALELLWDLSRLGPPPLAATAIVRGIDAPPLARALTQLLDRCRDELEEAGDDFESWYARL